MNRLHPLAPIGLGTENVESLVSYLIRLATSHSTSIGILLRFLEASNPGVAHGWAKLAQRSRLSVHIRPNQTTRTLVHLLSLATGLSPGAFRSMSFLCLMDTLRRSACAFDAEIRWCPACFREWRKEGATTHLKLAWHARLMTHCDVHRCALRSRCPGCGYFQTSYEMRESIDTCCKKQCRTFLGEGLVDDCSSSWEDCAPEVRELLAYVSATPDIVFPRHGVRRTTQALQKEMTETGDWESFRDGFKVCTRRDIDFKRSDSVTLLKAVEISRAAGVALPELLLGSIKNLNRTLPLKDAQPNPPAKPLVARRHLGSRKIVRAKVQTFLKSRHEKPPPLRAVAAHVGASVGGLQHLLPELCEYIVKRHCEHARSHRATRSAQLDGAIEALLKDWNPVADGALSRKAMLRRLIVDPRWSKNLIRERVKSCVAA